MSNEAESIALVNELYKATIGNGKPLSKDQLKRIKELSKLFVKLLSQYHVLCIHFKINPGSEKSKLLWQLLLAIHERKTTKARGIIHVLLHEQREENFFINI